MHERAMAQHATLRRIVGLWEGHGRDETDMKPLLESSFAYLIYFRQLWHKLPACR